MQILKSKITEFKQIDWAAKIIIEKLIVDKISLDVHRSRINKVFENHSNESKEEYIMQIVIRDNILNLALSIIEKSFKFDINDEDIAKISERINKSISEKVVNPQPLDKEAMKLNTIFFIKRVLIFDKLAKEYEISVSDQELKEILNQYYTDTNQPIRDIINDDENLKNAKRAFLDEKIIAFILEKYKGTTNLDKLWENMQNSHTAMLNIMDTSKDK